jgi:uncharacterized protein YkwD
MDLLYCIRIMKVFVVDNEDDKLYLFMKNLKELTKHWLYKYVTSMAIMIQIIISAIFLIVISMVLPTSAIMYASGQSTDNSDNLRSATGESTDNSGSSSTDNSGSSTASGGATTTTNPDNSGSSTASGGATTTTNPDNSGSSTASGGATTTTNPDNSGSSTASGGATTTTNPDNSGSSTASGGSTISNSTGNTQGADIIGSILTIHNRERTAVGVPPLVWNDKLAAGAKNWAEQMVTTAGFAHSTCCGAFKNYGEGIAGIQNATNLGIIDGEERWIAEKNNPGYHGGPFYPDPKSTNGAPGHYTQIVWKSTTEVGCGIAPPGNALGFMVLVCQYKPPGNIFGQPAY